jgi:hypothetical protein
MREPKEKAQEILKEMYECGKDMMVPRHVTINCAKVALKHIQRQSQNNRQYNYWLKVAEFIDK